MALPVAEHLLGEPVRSALPRQDADCRPAAGERGDRLEVGAAREGGERDEGQVRVRDDVRRVAGHDVDCPPRQRAILQIDA